MLETTENKQTLEPIELSLPEPLVALERLSWNYWWSWSTDGAATFRDLDAEVWEDREHNPRLLLSRVSDYRLAQMATDPVYIERDPKLAKEFDDYMNSAAPFRGSPEAKSMTGRTSRRRLFVRQYGVHNSLPLYSGGLGIRCRRSSEARPAICVCPWSQSVCSIAMAISASD